MPAAPVAGETPAVHAVGWMERRHLAGLPAAPVAGETPAVPAVWMERRHLAGPPTAGGLCAISIVRTQLEAGSRRYTGMTDSTPKRGAYTRGYLPHIDHDGLLQFITFGLADAAPKGIVADGDRDLGDLGHGACLLRDPENAEIVRTALLHFDGERYELGPWVIMPNHIHVVIRPFPGRALCSLVHSWKSFTAKCINRRLGCGGPVWEREYFDQYIRDARHLEAVTRYIHENPVKAGLVQGAEDWPSSSANR